MINDMTFEDVRKLLDLSPNATCGYVRVTFVSKRRIAPGGLQAPFADGRPAGSALYFMLTPEEPVKLHRIRNDQLYHYYLGDPIEVLMMLEDGSTEFHIVGPDLLKGHQVQLFIPGGTFHTARVIGKQRWFLGASTEWPGVEPADVELGNADALVAKFPKVAAGNPQLPGTKTIRVMPHKTSAIGSWRAQDRKEAEAAPDDWPKAVPSLEPCQFVSVNFELR